jgi:tetratricopeptide (TPR) repeat protein
MLHENHITWPEILWLFHRCERPGSWLLTLPLTRIRTCTACRENCGDLEEMLEAGEIADDADYHDLVLARSRRRARKIWEPLAAQPQWLRRAARKAPPLWGLVELLVEESRRQASLDPAEALAFAQEAVAMAHRMPARRAGDDALVGVDEEEPLGLSHQAEVLALAHAVLGNAYRVGERIHEAAAQFVKAKGYLMDVREGCLFHGRARVLSMEASLLIDTRRLRQAVEVLEEAQMAARRERPQSMSVLIAIAIKLGNALSLLGEHKTAVHTLSLLIESESALGLPPHLELRAKHLLANELLNVGRAQQAQGMLPGIQDLARRHDQRSCSLRVEWLEARIVWSLERSPKALVLLDRVQEGFIAAGCAHESALVALERSLVLHELGNGREVLEAAKAALHLLLPLQVSDEALCALSLVLHYAQNHRLEKRILEELLRWAEGGEAPPIPRSLGEEA